MAKQQPREYEVEKYTISQKPYYKPINKEIEVFEAAYKLQIPFAAIGPTGCGKTRFIQYMAYRLGQPITHVTSKKKKGTSKKKKSTSKKKKEDIPFYFVTCHEDLSAPDLLGRDRISGDYLRGILLRWASTGGFFYLDEVPEARKDLMTLLHPVMEPGRRIFYNEKTGLVHKLDDSCMLTMSWNPGYQDVTKRLKPSTRQRLITQRFAYPSKDVEAEIIQKESGANNAICEGLAVLGEKIRNIKESGDHALQEGASTRLLIYAGKLMGAGIDPKTACEVAIINCLTEDVDDTHNTLKKSLDEVIELKFFEK